MTYYVYFLECSDKSIYTGSTAELEVRITQHQSGFDKAAYTYLRRPVRLIKAIPFESEYQALAAEHRAKKWSRAKKWAFINGDEELFRQLSLKPRKKKG